MMTDNTNLFPSFDEFHKLNEAKITNKNTGETYTKKEINDTIKFYKEMLKSSENSLKFNKKQLDDINAGNSIYVNTEKAKKDIEEGIIVTQKIIDNWKRMISDWEKFRDTGETPIKN